MFLGLLFSCSAIAEILNLKCSYRGTGQDKYGQIIMIDWDNSKLTWNDGFDLAEFKIVKKDDKYFFNAYQVDEGGIRKEEYKGSSFYNFSLTLMTVSLFDNNPMVNFAQAFGLSIYEDDKELILMPEKKGNSGREYFGTIHSLKCLYM